MEPRSVTYLSNRAAAYMSANRFEEALEDSKTADEIEPQNPKVLHRLARIYTTLGRPSEAIDVLDRIASFQTVTQQDRSPAQSMLTDIKRAEDAVREGTTGSMAIHALNQAERGLGVGVQKPRKWQLLRAEAYLKMGNPNALGEAQNVAMSLLRKNNQDPEALVLRGRALYSQGENEKALQHFRQALSCDPDFKDGVKYLRMVQKLDRMKEEGNAAFKGGRFKQAVGLYSQALEIDPNNKGTNSKILQNRAMASIKVFLSSPSRSLPWFLTPHHSSKNTNQPSQTAPAPSALTLPTPKPAKPKPAPSANPATGKPPSTNTNPLPNLTPTSPVSPRRSATPSSSSRKRNARTTTRSSQWRKTPPTTRSRKRTESWRSCTTRTKTPRTRAQRSDSKTSEKRTKRSVTPKNANATTAAKTSSTPAKCSRSRAVVPSRCKAARA